MSRQIETILEGKTEFIEIECSKAMNFAVEKARDKLK